LDAQSSAEEQQQELKLYINDASYRRKLSPCTSCAFPISFAELCVCTNLIECAFSIVETVCRNVQRWVGSRLLVAERQFRKVIGHHDTPLLLSSMANYCL
jgi:hypothetical protein